MGSPKGLLQAPDGSGTLLDRLLSVARSALPEAPVVLMGQHGAYAAWPHEQVPDALAGAGPIGGLLSLARLARQRGYRFALTLACDMPRVSSDLLVRLAHWCPNQPNLVARVDGRYQPFFARYDPASTEAAILALVQRGRYSMASVLEALRAQPLPMDPREARLLSDWDTPSDVTS